MPAEDAHEAFIALLNNRPRDAKPRDRGFVVLVEQRRSLAALQNACFRQNYNRCYTARYRMGASAVFGTLPVAVRRDIALALEGEPCLGVFRPALNEVKEKHLLADFGQLARGEEGPVQLYADEYLRLLDEIDRLTRRSVGARFVLFCELADDAIVERDWELAATTFLHRLPERIGLVFSGVPPTIGEILERTAVEAEGRMPAGGAAEA